MRHEAIEVDCAQFSHTVLLFLRAMGACSFTFGSVRSVVEFHEVILKVDFLVDRQHQQGLKSQ